VSKNKENKKLTVLHVANLNQPIRQDLDCYGPIEMVIHNLDKGLHTMGYRSVVACSGDSKVTGEHYITIDKSIGNYCLDRTSEGKKRLNHHLSRIIDRINMGDIDIIHTHDGQAVKSLYDSAADLNIPIVMTLHVAPEVSNFKDKYAHLANSLITPLAHYVPISEYQKKQYTFMNTENVVYNGIDASEYTVNKNRDNNGYLFSIGRITPDKGQAVAIDVAKKSGRKLIIAGCVQDKTSDRAFFSKLKNSIDLFIESNKYQNDDEYYNEVITPVMESDKQIIFVGEISDRQKKQLYSNAYATLFPIQWGEPFGLVMTESMASGTPVVALNKGSVPEIVLDKKTGYVVDSVKSMADSISIIDNIRPRICRKHVEDNFSVSKMANDYLELYQNVLEQHLAKDKVNNSEVSPLKALTPRKIVIP